jgi:hypothetical protein
VPPRNGPGEIVIYPEDTTVNLVIKTRSPFSSDAIPLSGTVCNVARAADETAVRMSVNSQVMRIYQIDDADTVTSAPVTGPGKQFYGTPEQRLVISDYIALPEMEEFFFELIPGWTLVRTRRGYDFRLSDPVTGSEITSAPVMFIDGTATTDATTIAGVSPYVTEYIDLFSGNFRIGEILLPPMVNVVTRKGDYRMQTLPPGSMRSSYRFSNTPLRFRSPGKEESGHIPQLSNTLLWMPAAQPDSDGGFSIILPRPDYKRAVKVTLTVLGTDGHLSVLTREVDPAGL